MRVVKILQVLMIDAIIIYLLAPARNLWIVAAYLAAGLAFGACLMELDYRRDKANGFDLQHDGYVSRLVIFTFFGVPVAVIGLIYVVVRGAIKCVRSLSRRKTSPTPS